MSRKNNGGGGAGGDGEVARMIAGALGLVIGAFVLWILVTNAVSVIF